MSKTIYTLLAAMLLLSLTATAQGIIGSVNSAAISSNQYAHTVGEIFVIPDNSSQPTPSGVLGINSYNGLSVGIAEATLNPNQIAFYPNPVRNMLNIESKEKTQPLEVVVYDVSGRHILSQTLVVGNKVDMSAVQSGTYIISVKDGTGSISARLIKD